MNTVSWQAHHLRQIARDFEYLAEKVERGAYADQGAVLVILDDLRILGWDLKNPRLCTGCNCALSLCGRRGTKCCPDCSHEVGP